MASGSHSSRAPKAAEIASETKRRHIPWIKKDWKHKWSIKSILYVEPLQQLRFSDQIFDLTPPDFQVVEGDPVDVTLEFRKRPDVNGNAGFICPANEKKPGGEWETAVEGVEERLCRRSTLSANLGRNENNYPIPLGGGIYSHHVVVFRGPRCSYPAWEAPAWKHLPVCSMPPQRWPKLTENGTKYSFDSERDIVMDKLRAAVRIMVFNRVDTIVIGDWGLGKGCRNPPQELAELWREVFLWDPFLRGRVRKVVFAFEYADQSTTAIIQEEQEKQIRRHHHKGISSSSKGKSRSKSKRSSPSGSSSSGDSAVTAATWYQGYAPLTDMQIFQAVFHENEIRRVLYQPDARYGIDMLTTN